MTQDVNSKQELPKDEPSNNMNTSTNLLTVIEALQCQIQPQFITLQNAFLPQQMPTNTTEDVQLVQTTTASEAGIHINPFLPSTQIPQQLLNCQEGPQQFVQSGHDTQNANGLFEVVQPMRTMTEEGQESLFEYLPNIEETGVFLDGTQPIQINGQQIFLTANGQIIEASNNVIQTNFLQEIGQPPQIPTASVNTLTITPKVSFPTESSDITPTNTNAEVIYLTTNNNSKEDIEQEEQVSDQNQSQIQCQIIPIASLPIPTSEVGTTQETNVQQTVPVQLPISLENGETVYLTVQLPPSSLTEKILGVIQPEIQAIPQYAQQQMGGSLNLVLGNEVQDHTIPDAPQLSESNDFLLQQQEHQQMHQRQSDVNESSKYARKIHCTCPNCTNFIGDSNQKRKHICHLEGCNKHYDKPYQLKAHLKWHTGEKPHKCDFSPGVCFKRFKRADQLQRHLRTHSREKRFECPQCLRMFSRSDHLANHIDVHIRKNKKIWVINSTDFNTNDNCDEYVMVKLRSITRNHHSGILKDI